MGIDQAIDKEMERIASCSLALERELKKKHDKQTREHLERLIGTLYGEISFWKEKKEHFKNKGYEHPATVVKEAKKSCKERIGKVASSRRTILFVTVLLIGAAVFWFFMSILFVFYLAYVAIYASIRVSGFVKRTWNESLVKAYEQGRRSGSI